MSKILSFSSTQDFVQGGLVDNVDVELRNCRWDVSDYGGKSSKPAVVFAADLHEIMKDGSVSDEKLTEQLWSAGNADNLTPVADKEGYEGRYLEAENEHVSLKKGSNFFLWLESLEKLGCKGVSSDAASFNGLQVHVARIPAPERAGLDMSDRDPNKKPTVLIAATLISNPNEGKAKSKAGAAGKPAGKATAAAPAAAEVTDEARAAAVELVQAGMADGTLKDGIAVAAVRTGIIRLAIKNKVETGLKNAVQTLLKDDAELEAVLSEAGALLDDGKFVTA